MKVSPGHVVLFFFFLFLIVTFAPSLPLFLQSGNPCRFQTRREEAAFFFAFSPRFAVDATFLFLFFSSDPPPPPLFRQHRRTFLHEEEASPPLAQEGGSPRRNDLPPPSFLNALLVTFCKRATPRQRQTSFWMNRHPFLFSPTFCTKKTRRESRCPSVTSRDAFTGARRSQGEPTAIARGRPILSGMRSSPCHACDHVSPRRLARVFLRFPKADA